MKPKPIIVSRRALKLHLPHRTLVIEDLRIKRDGGITLQPGLEFYVAIRNQTVGLVVTSSPSEDIPFFATTICDFEPRDLSRFLIPGHELIPRKDGRSYKLSILRYVLLKHLKPEVCVSPREGFSHEVRVTFKYTPVGKDKPGELTMLVDLTKYLPEED